MKTTIQGLRLLLVLTLLTGLVYPVAVWALGRALFKNAAEGSLVTRGGKLAGSHLIAQNFEAPGYFHPRPSAGSYGTVASGASNQAWTNKTLAANIAARREAAGGGDVPADLLTSSGSGLDPDISIAAANFQKERVATARGLDAEGRQTLNDLIALLTQGGTLSPARVNVLKLNLALDAAFSK